MKRVDFSSVIKILLSYRSLSEIFSQGEFIAELFSAFYEKSDASSDDGQVSRWVNGDERVPERYAAFYSENLNSLCTDILTNIFPVLSDRWQAVNEIRDLVLYDTGISENKKSELLCGLNPNNDYSCAEFIAKVLLFAMQRGISDLWKHSESASPVLSGIVFGCDVPKVQLIEHYVCVSVALELNNDTHTVAVGFIADNAYALNTLVAYKVAYAHQQTSLVYHVGYLVYDNACLVVLLDDVSTAAQDYLAASGIVSGAYSAVAHDDTAGREIRTLYLGHELLNGYIGIVDHQHERVNDLTEVVRRDIRSHTNRDTVTAVYKQVRETRRKHYRLLELIIVVRCKINDLLADILDHLV